MSKRIHIAVLLDLTNSVVSSKSATISEFNSLLDKLTNIPELTERNLSFSEDMSDSTVRADYRMTLMLLGGHSNNQTDSDYTINTYAYLTTNNYTKAKKSSTSTSTPIQYQFKNKPINEVNKLDPTSLDLSGKSTIIDACIEAIKLTSAFPYTLPRTERADKTIFVSYTCGIDEGSRQRLATLASLVNKKIKQGWEFMWLGADLDNIYEATPTQSKETDPVKEAAIMFDRIRASELASPQAVPGFYSYNTVNEDVDTILYNSAINEELANEPSRPSNLLSYLNSTSAVQNPDIT